VAKSDGKWQLNRNETSQGQKIPQKEESRKFEERGSKMKIAIFVCTSNDIHKKI